MRSIAVVALLAATAIGSLTAQGSAYVPPKPPCNIQPGFFRINSAVVDLQTAVEKPNQRDHMLSLAVEVLTRTIRDDHQDKNPAAWYYLGRYYVEVHNAAGADTAFSRAEELAPQCKEDIAGYRHALWDDTFRGGLAAWQAGQTDSAIFKLHLAQRLDAGNPRPLLQLGQLFASQNQADSAAKYLTQGADLAAGDTTYADARRDALGTVARLRLARSQADPAVQRSLQARQTRDSLAPYLANDSTVLARVQLSAASRRARGARLSPADQRDFTADSTKRAASLSAERALRDSLDRKLATDSAAVTAAYAPAVTAYRNLTTAYPAAVEAATNLAAIYVQSGHPELAGSAFDAAAAHPAGVDPAVLMDAGQRFLQGRLYASAARVATIVLAGNPYQRDALVLLIGAAIKAPDGAAAVDGARRLLALEPMSQNATRLAAQAWIAAGRTDSAKRYQARADSGLNADVAVVSFAADTAGANLSGSVTNLKQAPTKAMSLVFEFLDAKGTVIGSQTAAIASLSPGGSTQFQLHQAGKGIAGWRYRVT
ncbi:MAG TPA: FxLYD domain-containing protein [Gemmatimonadales bacterium]